MKENRILELLASRPQTVVRGLEEEVAIFHRVRQVNRPHARLACHAIELRKCEVRLPDWKLDPRDKSIGKFRMRFNGGVVDDLSKSSSVRRRDPLPRHAAIE